MDKAGCHYQDVLDAKKKTLSEIFYYNMHLLQVIHVSTSTVMHYKEWFSNLEPSGMIEDFSSL